MYIDVLLHRVLGKKETLNKNMILMFLNVFMIIRLNHFYVKIVVILSRGREFFTAKCVHFPSGAVTIHIWDKPYQENNVVHCKKRKVLSDLDISVRLQFILL